MPQCSQLPMQTIAAGARLVADTQHLTVGAKPLNQLPYCRRRVRYLSVVRHLALHSPRHRYRNGGLVYIPTDINIVKLSHDLPPQCGSVVKVSQPQSITHALEVGQVNPLCLHGRIYGVSHGN